MLDVYRRSADDTEAFAGTVGLSDDGVWFALHDATEGALLTFVVGLGEPDEAALSARLARGVVMRTEVHVPAEELVADVA